MFTNSRFATLGAARHNAKYGNRTVPSERMPVERPDVANGRLQHASVLQVKNATQTRAELAARAQRRNEMFENLKAVAGGIPSFSRAGGGNIKETADYKALAALDVDAVVQKEYPSVDAARKAQARINLYARSGAGTFRTAVRGNHLFICRTSTEYTAQRQRGGESVL